MINERYLFKVLSNLQVPRECSFLNVDFFVTEDKHYPGIKKITIDSMSYNIYFVIQYEDIVKIFQTENKPLKMRGICKYLMTDDNMLDQKASDNVQDVWVPFIIRSGFPRNQILENKNPYNYTKNIKVLVENSNLKIQIAMLCKMIAKKSDENQFVIQSLKDLY